MTDEEIKIIVNNVAVTPDGLKFIELLLDKLGAFERGFNFQNHDMEVYNKARREQGLWLLDILIDSNFDKYTEIIKHRKEEQCKKKN